MLSYAVVYVTAAVISIDAACRFQVRLRIVSTKYVHDEP
jgi:hypothetical protein